MELIKGIVVIIISLLLGSYLVYLAMNINKLGDADCVLKYKDYPMSGRFILNCTLFGDNFRSK